MNLSLTAFMTFVFVQFTRTKGSSIETIGRQDRNRAEQEFENDNIYAFGVSEGLQNEIDEIGELDLNFCPLSIQLIDKTY